jgi:hypothetical protein
MDSLDLNRLVKEADILKEASEILKDVDEKDSDVCLKFTMEVKKREEPHGRNIVVKQAFKIETDKERFATINHTNEVTQHMENNLPARCLYSTTDEAGAEDSLAEKTDDHLPSKGTGPSITHLKLEEYEIIPEDMKGRLTYEMVNEFIDAFNMALKKKYELLSHPRMALKGKELTKYDEFKEQETTETIEKGIYFCVADDLKNVGNKLLDRISYNILNILRFCKRLREIYAYGITLYALQNYTT